MTGLRYLSAFLVSSLTFVLFYFGFLSLPKIEKKLKPAPSKVIKIALVTAVTKVVKPPLTPMLKAVATPIVPLPIVKKVKKKKLKKLVAIKKPKPKSKKIIKKKIIKKKIVKKKVIKKPRPKKIIKKRIIKKKLSPTRIEKYIPIAPPIYRPTPPVYVAPKAVVQPVLKPTKVAPLQAVVKNNHHKKAFLRNVRSKIIANKKYPKIAKRRHIEGSVKVRFDITKHGHVSNIRFINGKRIFQKSIRRTLERTFPMGIPNNIKNTLPISDISVILHFNLR